MASHPGARRELIDELMKTRREAHRLFITLRFEGRDKEADQAEATVSELTRHLERLFTDEMQSWEGQAAAMVAELQQLNHYLARDIARIRRRAARTEDIAAALGRLGEALEVLVTWGL